MQGILNIGNICVWKTNIPDQLNLFSNLVFDLVFGLHLHISKHAGSNITNQSVLLDLEETVRCLLTFSGCVFLF